MSAMVAEPLCGMRCTPLSNKRGIRRVPMPRGLIRRVPTPSGSPGLQMSIAFSGIPQLAMASPAGANAPWPIHRAPTP